MINLYFKFYDKITDQSSLNGKFGNRGENKIKDITSRDCQNERTPEAR